MAFLLDSNTLIQGKNEAYGFDICPGFWDFLKQEHESEHLYSIKPVGDELKRGTDELSKWAKKQGSAFFLPLDTAAMTALTDVVTWVQGRDFTDTAKKTFFKSADQYLIAFAKAHGHTLVSHEVLNREQKNNVKIPVVCDALKIPCVRTYDWIRSRKARFILEEP
jgi:hypothetical protein